MNEADDLDERRIIDLDNDYAAGHPVWILGGTLADLDGMHFTAPVHTRLLAWAAYWESHMHWERGWTPGPEDDWFERERVELARAVADEIGREFAVRSDNKISRSAAPATNPAAADAMRAMVEEDGTMMRRRQEARGGIIAANIDAQFPPDPPPIATP